MKIIKKGRNQKNWSKEFTCKTDGGCGAVLLVSAKDFKVNRYMDLDGTRDHTVTFKCPCCGCINDVTRQVPTYVL